jgi:hypothetical protein
MLLYFTEILMCKNRLLFVQIMYDVSQLLYSSSDDEVFVLHANTST